MIPYREQLPTIRAKVSTPDLWSQLAEECVELAQAALKMERLTRGTNPPRKTATECRAAVMEELGDVYLVLEALHYGGRELLMGNMTFKAQRWVDILKEAENKAPNMEDDLK